MNKNTTFAQIRDCILGTGLPIVEFQLIDVWKMGEQSTMTLSVKFQAIDKTFTRTEIDGMMKQIDQALEKIT
jgi:phenylalanyl-tRNA synthetase beta subunit